MPKSKKQKEVEYLLPVNNEIVDFKNKLSPLTIGKAITIHGDDHSNLKGFDIALIGLSECRKSSEVNKKYIDINSFRKEFYSLYCGDWNVNIIDMGDIISGEDISDTYFALKTINESLLEKNIISFFIGGTQDLTFPLYQAFAMLPRTIHQLIISLILDRLKKTLIRHLICPK